MTGASAKVPSANRGPTNLNGSTSVAAIVDFLRFTAPQALIGIGDDMEAVHAECREFLDVLAPDSGLTLEEGVKACRRGYLHHVQILTPTGSACGDICWGGDRQRGTVSVEWTGAACARVCAVRPFAPAWGHVRAMLDTVGAKITRLDIAHDDYAGKRGLSDAVAMYDGGSFDGAFKRPAMQAVGWNDGSGRSVYIGKRTSTRQLVVYEKGREQGARDGDPLASWVRWEARFYGRNRVVPVDALEAPWEYMVGEYPALDWISAVMSVMRSATARATANFQGAMRHCKRQYGGLLGFLAGVADDVTDLGDLVSSFLAKRGARPRWLLENPHGWAVRGQIVPSLRSAALSAV